MYTYQKTIVETDLDFLGHVNHANYLRILEEARWDVITKKGFGFAHMQAKQYGPVILRVDIQYKREVGNRETITIHTDFQHTIIAKVMTLEQRITKEDGTVASVATITFGLMDFQTRKLIDPPQQWVDIMQAKQDA